MPSRRHLACVIPVTFPSSNKLNFVAVSLSAVQTCSCYCQDGQPRSHHQPFYYSSLDLMLFNRWELLMNMSGQGSTLIPMMREAALARCIPEHNCILRLMFVAAVQVSSGCRRPDRTPALCRCVVIRQSQSILTLSISRRRSCT